MTRELKFRAWDKKAVMMRDDGQHPNGKPHMKYDVGIMSKDARNEWASGIDGLEIRVDSDNFELMQFTGLKDKNRKEIYEGDIVKGEFGNDDLTGYVKFSNVLLRFEVVIGNEFTMLTAFNRPEVLGNIYQNPELLKP